MKISVLTLVALLATGSFAAAQNGRTLFNDGSKENSYVAGHITGRAQNNDDIAHKSVGRNFFGDGSVENNYVAGSHRSGVAVSRQFSTEDGRNGFGDGSPLSN